MEPLKKNQHSRRTLKTGSSLNFWKFLGGRVHFVKDSPATANNFNLLTITFELPSRNFRKLKATILKALLS